MVCIILASGKFANDMIFRGNAGVFPALPSENHIVGEYKERLGKNNDYKPGFI